MRARKRDCKSPLDFILQRCNMVAMNIAADIAVIEKQVKAAGLSVSGFLQKAGVEDSQWSRWKKGQIPLVTTWAKVEQAVGRLRKSQK